jgi:lipoprotein-releasing system permease protein
LNYELKIALRFLKSGKTQTIFILLGIAVGVSVMIFLGSLITSLQNSLVQKTIGNSSQITVKAADDTITRILAENTNDSNLFRGNFAMNGKSLDNWTLILDHIKKDSRVTAASPTVMGTAIIKGAGKDLSVLIKGIRLEDGDRIYDISSRLKTGDPAVGGNTILIGVKLSEDLGIKAGSTISLITPKGESVRFIVGGIFDLQNENVNETVVFMDLSRAQKLFQLGSGITAIETQITDPFTSDVVAGEWRNNLGDVGIDEWKAQNQQLLSALASQGSSSYTIQFFVILAVTLGISSVLAVSVVQKSKEIGILKAMGATKSSASRIFLYQGLILGILGSVAGSGMGILLIDVFQYFNSGNGSLVIDYQWSAILINGLIATVSGTLASLIPARRSAKLNPMEAIKNG